MTGLIIIAVGSVIFIIAMVMLFMDCYRGYGSTMGGEMLAGLLWAVGSVLFAIGLCLATGASLIFAAPAAIVLFFAVMPFRRVVARLGSRYGKQPPARLQPSSRPVQAMKKRKGKK